MSRKLRRLPSGVEQPTKRRNVREWLTEHGVPQEALIEDELAAAQERLAPTGSDAERRQAFIEAQCDKIRAVFEDITNKDGTAATRRTQFLLISLDAIDHVAHGVADPASYQLLKMFLQGFEQTDYVPAPVLLAAVFRLIVAFGGSADRPRVYGELCGALASMIAFYGEGLLNEQDR